MKKTLRQNIERIQTDLIDRIEQLKKHIEEYKQENNFESAMKCDIRLKQLEIILKRINEALEP